MRLQSLPHKMNGEIAVLYQGNKQIGGLYDWKIDITSESTIKNGWRESRICKEIAAQSYWLIDTPACNCFELKFYKVERGYLVLIDSGKVKIDLPSVRVLDCRLTIPIEIRWLGD